MLTTTSWVRYCKPHFRDKETKAHSHPRQNWARSRVYAVTTVLSHLCYGCISYASWLLKEGNMIRLKILVKCHLREISELTRMSLSFSDLSSEYSVMPRGGLLRSQACHRALPWGQWPTMGPPCWLVPPTLSELWSGSQGLHTCCHALGKLSSWEELRVKASLLAPSGFLMCISNHGNLKSSTGGARLIEGCTRPGLVLSI